MTDLTKRIEKLLEFSIERTREEAKHEDSDGYFGFLAGAGWEGDRRKPIEAALLECVRQLSSYVCRFNSSEVINCNCDDCEAYTNLETLVTKMEGE